MAQEPVVYESFLDKAIKSVRLVSHIVWLIIGILSLFVTWQLYQAYKTGEMSNYIQNLIPTSRINLTDEQKAQVPAEYQQHLPN